MSKRPAEFELEKSPSSKRAKAAEEEEEEGEILDSSDEEYVASAERRRINSAKHLPEDAVIVSVCDEEPYTLATYVIKRSDVPAEDGEVWDYLCNTQLSGKSVGNRKDWISPVAGKCSELLIKLINPETGVEPSSSFGSNKSTVVPMGCRIVAIHTLLLFF